MLPLLFPSPWTVLRPGAQSGHRRGEISIFDIEFPRLTSFNPQFASLSKYNPPRMIFSIQSPFQSGSIKLSIMATMTSRRRSEQAAALADVGGEAERSVGGVWTGMAQCASVSSWMVHVNCNKLLWR